MNEFDEYDDTTYVKCPNCDGFSEVPCYCGGDLCICDYNGYRPCPTCGGEGEVSEARYERYEENQRRNAELMRRIMERAANPPPPPSDPEKRPHQWVPSTLGHGEQMCANCGGTNRELSALGELDHCSKAVSP